MMNYTLIYEDALSTAIVGHYIFLHQKLAGYFIVLGLFCFVILGIWRYIETLMDSTGNKSFPYIEIMFHAGLVLVMLPLFSSFFVSIISLFNYLADQVMTVEETINVFSRLWTDKFDSSFKQKWYEMTLMDAISLIISLFGLVSAFIIMGLRYFLLSLYYMLFPFLLIMSLLPNYGFSKIIEAFTTIIQISSWVLLFSFMNVILSKVSQNGTVHWIQSLIIMLTYASAVLNIPRLANMIFGGHGFSPLAYTSALMAKNAFSIATSRPSTVVAKTVGGVAIKGASSYLFPKPDISSLATNVNNQMASLATNISRPYGGS